MTNLPPDLITDIFTRLPAKSLLRFRCISKPWCSQIDSRSFAKAHLRRSLETGANLHLITGFLGIYIVDLDLLDRATHFRPPFSASDFSTSVNGLVLVLAAKPATPFVWNPFTGNFHQLPPHPPEQHAPPSASVFEAFGFGYDSGRDDHVVVRVVELRDEYGAWICSKAVIYSCNSGTWRETCNFPYTVPYKRVWGVHLNGVLHTATNDDNNHGLNRLLHRAANGGSELSIMGFDVRNEQHLTLPKPRLTGPDAGFTIEVLSGYLCLIRPRKKSRMDIWIMKEYGVKESWTLLLSITPRVVESYVILCPLAISKDGLEVLLNHDDKRLIWYHLEKKSVRDVCVDGMPFIFYADVCVASLVSPSPREADQQRRWEGRSVVGRNRDSFLSKGFKLLL